MRVFVCLFLFLCVSCSNDKPMLTNDCVPLVFDETKFNSEINFGLQLVAYHLEGYCLDVVLGISGCDDNHTIELVTNGILVTSDPSTLMVDFYDHNPQLCKAYFTVSREFDLTAIDEKFYDDIQVKFRNNEGLVKINS